MPELHVLSKGTGPSSGIIPSKLSCAVFAISLKSIRSGMYARPLCTFPVQEPIGALFHRIGLRGILLSSRLVDSLNSIVSSMLIIELSLEEMVESSSDESI